MAAPLLGLASLLGREYAYTRPTYKEQDDILKVLSPQTYYGNKLINYLTEKLDVDSDLSRAQNTIEQASRRAYDNGPKGITQEEYDQQMAELSAQVNAPGSADRFENYLRDADYGTITPVDSQYVGPLEEYDSLRADDEYNFMNSLSNSQPGLQNDTNDLGEITIVDQKDSGGAGGDFMPRGSNLSYTDMIDVLNSTSNVGGSGGLNLPGTESLAPAGSVYDASIGANTPITESLAPVGYTFDVNTGTVVPATDILSSAPVGSTYDPDLGMNVPATATPAMPDYSRAYSALGGAESVSNLRDQLLGMGISEDIIGSAFAAYYAPETSNEGIKSIFSQDGYRNGGFLNRGGR
jgi:hypothetical protein